MKNGKFVGICIIAASVVLALALFYHAQKTSAVGRYQFHLSNHPNHPPGTIYTIDTLTGEINVHP